MRRECLSCHAHQIDEDTIFCQVCGSGALTRIDVRLAPGRWIMRPTAGLRASRGAASLAERVERWSRSQGAAPRGVG
jgi:hypothetical protein